MKRSSSPFQGLADNTVNIYLFTVSRHSLGTCWVPAGTSRHTWAPAGLASAGVEPGGPGAVRPSCCPIPTARPGRGRVCGDGTLAWIRQRGQRCPMGRRERLGQGSRQAGHSVHLSGLPPTHLSVHPPTHLLIHPSVPPNTHLPVHLPPHPLTHPGLVDPALPLRSQGGGCWLPQGLVAEPGERCHLPRVMGAMLPWSLVALVLLSPIKAARWPWVQRAVPALCTSSRAGEEPSSGCTIRPCTSSLCHRRPKMPRTLQPLSLLVLLVLAAPVRGQAGRCPRAPASPCAPRCP